MKITVRADTVYSVIRISDNSIIPYPGSKLYMSVNSLFGIIQNPNGDSLIVTYDPEYGYPDKVDINPQMHPVDGGVIYFTSNLRIIK
ncbi:MAG: hypothetical protein CVV24_03000 [Ignavibacteriae bacterium HGW-Ignavibacteriae-3]|nr:MAG: hypothetical protein CVV24_03000 [Ignavibacteriae bacterium HGW-Ignavibacteriae-3]